MPSMPQVSSRARATVERQAAAARRWAGLGGTDEAGGAEVRPEANQDVGITAVQP